MFINTANGKNYVGQTWNYHRRIRDHLNGHGGAKLLAAAIKKYGQSEFKIDVIASNLQTQEELDHEEIKAIARYESLCPGGYNLNKGGSGGQHSEATKQLIGNYHRGKLVSQETRMKLRLLMMGKRMSEDAKARAITGIRAYHQRLDKPVYFFDAYTHERVRAFKNMTEVRNHITFPSHSVYNSICHEWTFQYEEKRCYARYNDRPLEKSFQAGRREVIVRIFDTTETLLFSSTADATRKMHVGRGVIDCLVRNKSKKSKGVYQNKPVLFTASYYERM